LILRYLQGEGAPPPDEAHIDDIMKKGVWKVNWTQRGLRETTDLCDHPKIFLQVKDLLEDLMRFSHDNVSYVLSRVCHALLTPSTQRQLQYHLPKSYTEIKLVADILPLNEQSPADPFICWVLNLCACTKAHRDTSDKKWCTAFTLGDCEGGQLALHELGLVFDSAPGDMVAFHSCDQTHFNLHMKGIHASLVLHSDREGDKWGDDYNRWGSHAH